MRISKISIINYRQYKNLELNFKKTDEHDMHLILAENGIGKTTLLNSINWCLYGDEPHITLKEKALPIINLSSFEQLGKGQKIEIKIRIHMELVSGTLVYERTEEFRKTDDGNPFSLGQDFKVIKSVHGRETEVHEDEDASIYINRYIPKRIRKFFFFDGEQLDTYFTKETGANLEQAIFEISQIDLLQGMSNRLDILSGDYRKEISRKEPELEELTEKYEKSKANSEELKEKIEKISIDLSRNKERLKEINEELGNEPSIEELELRRSRLKNLREKELSDLNEVSEEFRMFIRDYSIILNNVENLVKLRNKIDSNSGVKEEIPAIDRSELVKILELNNCTICDRELTNNSIENIESILSKINTSSGQSVIHSNLPIDINHYISKAKKYPETKTKLEDRRNKLQKSLDDITIEYNNVENLLDKFSDKERIRGLQKERTQLEEEIERLKEDNIIAKMNFKNLEKELVDSEFELEREYAKSATHVELKEEYELTKKAYETVLKIMESIKQDVRSKIELKIQENFFDFLWKEDTFEEIILHDNYSLSLMNKEGYESLGSCSAAERALLALSFTLALHEESGYEGPLIIDTPISRVSGVLRENFAKVLKEVSKNKEIILFLTRDEYSENVQNVFEGNTSSKTRLYLEDEKYIRKEELYEESR